MYQIYFFHREETQPTPSNTICLNEGAPHLPESYCFSYTGPLTPEQLAGLPDTIPKPLHQYMMRRIERIYNENKELGTLLRQCVIDRMFGVIHLDEQPAPSPPCEEQPSLDVEEPQTQRQEEAIPSLNAETDMETTLTNDFALVLQRLARVSDHTEVLEDNQRIQVLQEAYESKVGELELLEQLEQQQDHTIAEQEEQLEALRATRNQTLQKIEQTAQELGSIKTELVDLKDKHQSIQTELQMLQEHKEELRKLSLLLKHLNLE